jgi:hypothetical protein
VEELPVEKSQDGRIAERARACSVQELMANSMPSRILAHKGAPLSEGILCNRVIECDWHGWQFDLLSGECLTVPEKIETYQVIVDDGVMKILI